MNNNDVWALPDYKDIGYELKLIDIDSLVLPQIYLPSIVPIFLNTEID